MDMQYIVRPKDLAQVPAGRTIVDTHARLWHRPHFIMWTDGTGRERTDTHMVTMRGPVYLLPEGFTGALTLDGLSDAEPGDYVLDQFGSRWERLGTGRWHPEEAHKQYTLSSEDLLAVHSPLLPAPRRGDVYARPVPAMEAAAREEEARPVSFWRRLWNGLVWG